MQITSLFTHLIEQASNFGLDLHPPASELKIKEAQKEMDISFPNFLIEIYRCANGEVMPAGKVPFGLFGGIPFASLDRMVEKHRQYSAHIRQFNAATKHLNRRSNYRSLPVNTSKAAFFNSNWIPFALSDINHSYLAVDLDPSSDGVLEQILMFGPDSAPYVFQVSEKLDELLRTLQQQYEKNKGNPAFGDESDSLVMHVGKKYDLHSHPAK